MIRVMLVDDHALVRMGFRMLLTDAQVEVVAEADSGEQASRVLMPPSSSCSVGSRPVAQVGQKR